MSDHPSGIIDHELFIYAKRDLIHAMRRYLITLCVPVHTVKQDIARHEVAAILEELLEVTGEKPA